MEKKQYITPDTTAADTQTAGMMAQSNLKTNNGYADQWANEYLYWDDDEWTDDTTTW